jgi:epoxyqueuosine reductase QueG
VDYIETNRLILDLNGYLRDELEKMGFRTAILPATHNFDSERLISDWSHRHIARIAGLGSFGLNNMLIIEKGCCGRLGSIVTTLEITPDLREPVEYCLFKNNGSCRKCVDKCVGKALAAAGFNRKTCYDRCLENANQYRELGLADVCGKCLVGLACSTRNPVKLLSGHYAFNNYWAEILMLTRMPFSGNLNGYLLCFGKQISGGDASERFSSK